MCFFTFDKLCNANVGAADYIALAKKFHTIALSGIPVFTASIRNQAYRYAVSCLALHSDCVQCATATHLCTEDATTVCCVCDYLVHSFSIDAFTEGMATCR